LAYMYTPAGATTATFHVSHPTADQAAGDNAAAGCTQVRFALRPHDPLELVSHLNMQPCSHDQ
jgi:hypothetical protein